MIPRSIRTQKQGVNKQSKHTCVLHGNEADNILSSLGLSDDDKKSYNTVKAKVKGHFVK